MVEQDSLVGIACLADPTRRTLYEFVCGATRPPTREEAALAVDLPLHKAKFHLDRLAEDGLLEVSYARDEGKGGPGSGRPAKRYRRAAREWAVSLPERTYALAGRLMARAIDESRTSGEPVEPLLTRAAREHGRTLATPASGRDPLEHAASALAAHGYEPSITGDTAVLRNCPFHSLAQAHTDLVCTMNLHLIEGLVESLGEDVVARLDPRPPHCCVTLGRCRPSAETPD